MLVPRRVYNRYTIDVYLYLYLCLYLYLYLYLYLHTQVFLLQSLKSATAWRFSSSFGSIFFFATSTMMGLDFWCPAVRFRGV